MQRIGHGKRFPDMSPRPNVDTFTDRESQMAMKGAILLDMCCIFQLLLGEEVMRDSSPSCKKAAF